MSIKSAKRMRPNSTAMMSHHQLTSRGGNNVTSGMAFVSTFFQIQISIVYKSKLIEELTEK
jgi:hypothetical protein